MLSNLRLLRPDVLSADALVHLYWTWSFRDPQLFTDGLTAELRRSARYPDGYEALLWLASQVANPIAFGEWLGVGLMALSGWLVFAIVREHTPWRPGAWIGAGLFLALFEIHRFYGGFPRAFVQPVVLLTVLLALRGHRLAAALCAAGGALFYPPAAVLAVGVLLVSAIRPPRLDVRRAAYAVLALVLMAAAVLGPELVSDGGSRVMTASEAREFPEFGEHGSLHFFVPSLLEYLRQNRSGFDLRTAGSIIVVAALALLIARPANLRLLRAEVLALPVVALGAYAVSQAVLFQLYLPHRYTYPLVAFAAIAIAVCLRPTWIALTAVPRPRLRKAALLGAPLAICAFAVYVFPLGAGRSRAGSGGDGGARRRHGRGSRAPAQRDAGGRRAGGRRRADRGARRTSRSPAERQRVPAVACLALPGRPAEGRRRRRRSARPDVRAGHRPARRRDLDPARALLRGGLLPHRSCAHVRDAAGLLRIVTRRDRRPREPVRRDAPVGQAGRDPAGGRR